MPELVLAHDLGTTGNKASLFDLEGHPLVSAFEGYATDYPRPGWAEQDPADWWRAISRSTRRVLAESGRRGEDVAVASFSGEMMSCLLVDAKGLPLRKAIIWADQRAEAEASWMAERLGAAEGYRITGHRLGASYTAAKVLWVRAHQPDLYTRTAKVLQAKDYAAWMLTGAWATDYSDASGTNLFDLRERRWSGEILSALGLEPELLPPVVPSATVIGNVTRAAAEATGLAPGTPVVIGGGDGACATVGVGAVHPGDAYGYIGSSAWVSMVSREPLADPQQRVGNFAHQDPKYIFPTGSMQAAGGAYDWLERVLRGDGSQRLYQELDALAAATEPGAKGLIFLPYLIGERSPYWNPHARASFVGLSMAHGRAEMARAVLEGVAFNLRLILDVFRELGAGFSALRLIGGGARSATWRQILADVFNLPILRPKLLVEATSLGAAIAGGVGVGLYPGYEVASQLVQVQPGEKPRPTAAARYDEIFPIFRETYTALAPIFERTVAP